METNVLNATLAAKQSRRHELARLPMEEKLRAVVKLQQMAAPILKKRGQTRSVWAF
ncbi:MAG: hypothetical protein QE570_10555 [Verrucomicrobiota bacterium]|jgi:hypothetical protein|nr:hypothetical protein [Verrucomicrobiaceae bacterium]MDH4453604.1 hypothetical protein [Verrucomicrobiota bacterium]